MTTKVTYHLTEEAEVLFMAAVRPIKNSYKNNKEEYAIKIRCLVYPDNPETSGSQTVDHLNKVSESKVDTKMNRKLVGEKHISFTTIYEPTVLDAQGNKLKIPTQKEFEAGIDLKEPGFAPRFNGRTDKARAIVFYKVVEYLGTKLVRLQGIKLTALELAPREEYKPVDNIIDEIKQFLA